MAKTTLRPRKEYKCTQSQLYAICLIIWASCKRHLSLFASLKGYYTLTFIADRLAEILAANNIPNAENRIDVAEEIRLNLKKKCDECCAKWQILKLYITKAFSVDLLKIKLEQAGESFYKKASEYNWEELAQLMNNGSKFIADNLTQLQAGNNMPATFQSELDALRTSTVLLYMQFQEATEIAKETTSQKINANNDIYKQMMLACKDGQQIFRHDRTKKEDFIFSYVLERVRGASSPYQEFEVPKNNTIIIKKLMANSPFINTGETELVVCTGDVVCTPGTGTTVPIEGIIILAEGVETITVLNQNNNIKGKCKVRVVKK